MGPEARARVDAGEENIEYMISQELSKYLGLTVQLLVYDMEGVPSKVYTKRSSEKRMIDHCLCL